MSKLREFDPLVLAALVFSGAVGLTWLVLPTVEAQAPTSGPRWSCSLDNIGATLTQCQQAADPGQRLYLTDVVAQSTTSTAGMFLLQYGTGANCGTGTVSLFPAAAAVVRLAAPANTVAPLVVRFGVPLMAGSATAICVLGVGTNTTTIQLVGYTAQQ